jgi:hypothetical protein
LKDVRQAKEKALKKDNKAVSFPGWDAVEAEASQKSPSIWLTVRDNAGNTIRRIKGESKKGFHRTAWDLRYPSPNAVSSVGGEASGSLVAPGTYSVSLSKEVDGVVTELQSPQTFVVEQLRKGTLAGSTPEQAVAFWQELADAQRVASALGQVLSQTTARLPLFEEAINRSQAAPGSLDTDYEAIRDALDKLDRQLNGLKAKRAVGEDTAPSINSRLSVVGIGTGRSTYGATPTLKRSLQIAQEEIGTFRAELDALINQTIPAFEAKLEKAGAPWVSGQALPKL